MKGDIRKPKVIDTPRIRLDDASIKSRLKHQDDPLRNAWQGQAQSDQSILVYIKEFIQHNKPLSMLSSLFERRVKLLLSQSARSVFGLVLVAAVVTSLFAPDMSLQQKGRDSAAASDTLAAVNESGSQDTTVSSEVEARIEQDLPVTLPEFSMYFPLGEERIVRRVSPESAAIPAFVYIDELQGVVINVTQQQFAPDQNPSVKDIATDFQATQIIQIDNMLVYHGYSERANRQSLVFSLGENLVLIAADGKISDDAWVGYIKSFSLAE